MLRRQLRFVRRTWLIMFAMGAFLFGLILARLRLDGILLATAIAIFGLLLFHLLKLRKQRLLWVVFIIGVTMAGLWRGSVYLQRLDAYQPLFGQTITIEATARDDAVYSERRQLIFSANSLQVDRRPLVGNIEIEGFGTPMVYRGDRIRAEGKIFPKRGDNQAGMRFAKIEVVRSDESTLNALRRKFGTGMQNVLPEPLASLGLGLLIGQRATLPEYLESQMVDVGLIHIVAVSGYNLTILVHISQRGLQKRSRYQALIGSILLISLFLLVTGFSPSIVRAAVVSGLSLLAWYYGRTMKPLMILLLSAVLTAGFNPLYLWSSIGWYLSFTAFFGVLILAPVMRQRFLSYKWRERMLPQILSETIAAQICTLPIILFIFGRLSVISIIANVLVVPVVPLTMIASLIAGIYGMIGPVFLGGFLVMPARLVLEYIVSVTGLLATIPGVNVGLAISGTQMAVLYGLIVIISVILWIKTKPVRAKVPLE